MGCFVTFRLPKQNPGGSPNRTSLYLSEPSLKAAHHPRAYSGRGVAFCGWEKTKLAAFKRHLRNARSFHAKAACALASAFAGSLQVTGLPGNLKRTSGPARGMFPKFPLAEIHWITLGRRKTPTPSPWSQACPPHWPAQPSARPLGRPWAPAWDTRPAPQPARCRPQLPVASSPPADACARHRCCG